MAGVERIIDEGVSLLAPGAAVDPGQAIFEVGPWSSGAFGVFVTASQFPCPEHSAHEFVVDYLRTVLGDENGEAFYCWSIADQFHDRVSLDDLAPFGVITSVGSPD